MPKLAFGVGSYLREAGNFTEIRCINMFAEKSPIDEEGVALISRWGLLRSSTVALGPVTAVMFKEGVFGGDVFTVSGGNLYRGTILIGAIVGAGPVSFAFSDTELVLTAGGSAYSYNGTNLQAVAFPDGASVTAVTFIAGLFVYVRAGSGKFYWSAVFNGRSVDPLDFATAESSPDPLVDAKVVQGNLHLIGAATIEVWFPSGALDLPFTRIDQRLYSKGAFATNCTRELDNTLFVVGNDGVVYRLGATPERLSDHGIEERIRLSVSCSTYTFDYEGHKFFVIRLSQGTWAYDVATGQWCEFQSYGRPNFRAQCAATVGTVVYLGDDGSGAVWAFTDAATDDGGVLESRWTAGGHILDGVVAVDNLQVEANVGWTDLLGGPGSTPQIEMRSSRDAGATYGSFRSAPLGAMGEYRKRARWTRCGMFDFPGMLFEFRITDPVRRRVSSIVYNAQGGGRSR